MEKGKETEGIVVVVVVVAVVALSNCPQTVCKTTVARNDSLSQEKERTMTKGGGKEEGEEKRKRKNKKGMERMDGRMGKSAAKGGLPAVPASISTR